MKKHLTRCLLSLVIATSLISVASISQTYAGHGHGNKYVCRWIPSHWYQGHFVPGKKVCWWKGYYSRCRIIPGHWYHGYWVPPRKICR